MISALEGTIDLLCPARSPFCIKAKNLLDDLGVEYTAAELDGSKEGYAIRAELAKVGGVVGCIIEQCTR